IVSSMSDLGIGGPILQGLDLLGVGALGSSAALFWLLRDNFGSSRRSGWNQGAALGIGGINNFILNRFDVCPKGRVEGFNLHHLPFGNAMPGNDYLVQHGFSSLAQVGAVDHAATTFSVLLHLHA